MGLFDFFKSRKHKLAKCSNPPANETQLPSGVCDIPLDAKYTPESITTLGHRDIFVFGSNLSGHHAGGAARFALNRFGAVWGQGEGLQGNSYAIPTMQGDIDTIKPYVDTFIDFAEYEKALTFYVTKIGCGIAGFAIKDIAPLFRNAYNLPNVILPIEFVDYIEKENRLIHSQKTLDTIETANEVTDKRHKAPIKIIGVGGSGSNSVERMIENPIQGVEYCVIDTEKYVLQSTAQHKVHLSGETNDPCGIIPRGESMFWFNRYYATPSNENLVRSMLHDSTKHIIIVSGLGRNTGVLATKWLIQLCEKLQLPTTLVCTIPFDFEGVRKRKYALDAAHGISADGITVKILDANDLQQVHPEMTFIDCWSFLDEYVAKTVHELCKELQQNAEGKALQHTVKEKTFREITTHCYGITRTFADIILGLNEEKKYTSPDQALSDLSSYLQRFREQGDDIAFLSVRILQCILHDEPELFAAGHLNVSRLRELVFEDKNFLSAYDKAYDSYCREKLINLVAYLNEFRRYFKPEELRRDLFENTDVLKFSACAPIHGFYYFVMSGATGMNYPVQFFVRAIRNLWSEITTDGILDADKMRRLMFGNHDESLMKLGLEATIQRDYIEDSPCHPEVFVPKVMGTAPIYVKDDKTGRFMRSCGEGKGPNSIPDWLEFQIAKQILENDKSYKHIGNYYIPKYDNTLPVYGEYSGRLVFRTQAEKLKFIEDLKRGKQ